MGDATEEGRFSPEEELLIPRSSSCGLRAATRTACTARTAAAPPLDAEEETAVPDGGLGVQLHRHGILREGGDHIIADTCNMQMEDAHALMEDGLGVLREGGTTLYILATSRCTYTKGGWTWSPEWRSHLLNLAMRMDDGLTDGAHFTGPISGLFGVQQG